MNFTTSHWLGAFTLAALAACSAPVREVVTQAPRPPMDCTQLVSTLQLPGTRITASESVPAGLTVSGMASPLPMPAHCKVTGRMKERTGTDGKPYAIGFEVRLPANWSGRFLFQTNGGNDGVVQPAFGNVVTAGATSNALLKGFAVLSSDAGHASEPAQAMVTINGVQQPAGLVGGNLFGLDPQARLDYGYQANAALTPMAKRLISDYYGEPVKRSYMMGCSNGGRHSLVAAARQPEQFDGIIAGNAGFNLPKAAIQHAWDLQAFGAVNPDIKSAFSVADMKLIGDKVLAACDALDGLTDGMVGNLPACQKAFELKSLQCSGAKTDACLSAAQVGALQKVFAGPVNSKGQQLYSDWPWDAGVGASAPGFSTWRAWKLQSPIAGQPIIGVMGAGSVAHVFQTPPRPVEGTPAALMKSMMSYNFDTVAPKIDATDATYRESAMQFMTPPAATSLAGFKARGGRLLVYHGNSDPVFSVNDTIRWYEDLNRNHAGHAADFARLFTVPGMNHCTGGPATDQFDMLDALVKWVEQGDAPAQVMAAARPGANADVPMAWSSNGKARTRPLCAWPTQPRYSGSGDINDGANFRCQ